jgi:predicted permease
VIATIALGIGANTAIFTVVDGILLQALPFESSERVVILCETHESVGDYCIASPPNVEDWGRASTTIESFGLARSWPFSMQETDGAQSVGGGAATPGWFEVHGLTATLGRLFAPAELEPGNNRVVVLSNAFWRTRFAADEDVIGSTIILDGNPFTVIGVLPEEAWIHDFAGAQIWVPLNAIQDDVSKRSWRGFVALGKLADGATLTTARDEMEAIRAALAIEYPATNEGWGLRIERLRDNVAGSARTTLLIFLGAVGLVLLIACANVANLLLVRSTARAQEFAVRASLGAGRLRLVRQLLTESFVLAAVGGVAGVLLALVTTRSFLALAPANIPRFDEVSVDAGVLAFAVLLTGATALLFGLAPALGVARAKLGETIKAKRSVDVRGHGTRNVLVVAELALAVMLLMGAGLLTRGFTSLLGWDPGFDRDGLIAMFAIAPADLDESSVAFFERAADELRALPDVEAAALTSAGPLFGGRETQQFDVVGARAASPDDRPSMRYYDVSPEYFSTMGIAIVRGRDIESTDTADSVPIIVVNETFARRHFPQDEALGKHIEAFNGTWEIVGVARDVRPFAPDELVGAEIYMPIRQFPRGGTYFVLRARGDPAAIVEAARARLRAFDRNFDPGTFRTLEEIAGRQLVSPRFNMLLIGLFAAVALVLAAIGTYGVIAYAVASRTHEIGIRLALGARPEVIRGSVIRRGMAMATVGLLLGIGGAVLLSRLLGSMLHGISPTDPVALAGVVGIFAVVALAACWMPAGRASRLDPQEALRAE